MQYGVFLLDTVLIAGPFTTPCQAEAYRRRVERLYAAPGLLPLRLTIRHVDDALLPADAVVEIRGDARR